MNFVEHKIYHIYNRGNNKQKIFFEDRNYDYFRNKVRKELFSLVDILAYCLMPNHFHLMVYIKPISTYQATPSSPTSGFAVIHPLARKIGSLLSSYTRAINIQEARCGSLFQQKTKSKCLNCEDGGLSYLLTCLHYIHQNPLKAGLVNKMEDWPYSSFNDYIDNKLEGFLITKLLYQITNIDPAKFYEDSYELINPDYLKRIW